jgi:hypothetical protein
LQPGPNIDILFPVVVWTAAGVKFTLAKMMWNGVSLGRSIGQVVNLDLDADGSIETYWRFYVDPVDPGEVNLFYEEAGAVGGFVVSVDKFGLLAPYIGLASTILVATVANSHLRQAC